MGNTQRVGNTNISGVQQGMKPPVEQKIVRSSAAQDIAPSIYAAGDHVRHKKFGKGVVLRVRGTGSDARVMVRFDDSSVGVKEMAVAIAPMIKTEG